MPATRSHGITFGEGVRVWTAVVGVILNLAVWFALHVLFSVVHEWQRFGMRILLPDFRSLDIAALFIAVAAFLALFRFRIGMLPTLGGAPVAGLVWRLLLPR